MSALSTLPGFVTILDILNGKVQAHDFVNVIGLVVDFRVPIETKGRDWKCQIRLYDSSIEDDHSVSLNVFRPQSEMPQVSCGDVVLIRQVRVQRFGIDLYSLLTHKLTTISIYEASKIPKPPGEASCALRSPSSRKDVHPDDKTNTFVSKMYHTINRYRLPDQVDFESMVMASANVRGKFSLLEDVKEGQFCDIVVQVVRPPHDAGNNVTLWVSDYTENSLFYPFKFNTEILGRDGDPYGYTDKFTVPAATTYWPGPYGKRCLQISCWEPHATAIREDKIARSTWVIIRNLQIKLGHNGANLEGYLREDRGAFGPKIGIQPLDSTGDSENIDPRVKEALRRKRHYERLRQHQLKDLTEASKAGQKRKAGLASDAEPKKQNSKARRRADRKLKQAQARANGEEEEDAIHVANLNPQVKCENQDKRLHALSEIMNFVQHETTIDGQPVKLQLPFVNLNHRTSVRVVDFSPSKLVDFARPLKPSEFDSISDDGEESVSGSGSEDDDEQTGQTTIEDFAKKRKWEWRFFLELEDAAVSDKQEKRKVWVAVDNHAAQCLVTLDASNLRGDEETLTKLREKMFLLWGNLEEKKEAAQEAARKGQPPCDSDDEDQERPESVGSRKIQLTNRPFSCCIQQYGIKVAEPDPAKANAGEGKRWQRMFRLFGTMIAG
ncbi:hypothetical protein F66182_2017 [Fusarium sp. NRRL 66182]|nr:hypothetical protein F66182_2017 [Fusarium sp. NRRL 66182]